MFELKGYYFSHDSNAHDDPKMINLIDQLGLEGYGAFWLLIELLRNQPMYRLPMAAIPRISKTYGTTNAKLTQVIQGYGLFEVQDGYFFSHSLIRRMGEVKQKFKERTLKGWETRLQNTENQSKLLADAMQSNAKNAKEKKGNEKKGNEKKGKEINGMAEASWEKAKSIIQNDRMFLELLSVRYRVNSEVIANRLNSFLNRLHETEDWKDVPALKRHFSNSLNKHGVDIPNFNSSDVSRKTAIVEPPTTMTKEEILKMWEEPTKNDIDYSFE